MNSLKWIVGAAAAVTLVAGNAIASDWMQWRGPELNGSAPAERNLPEKWSKTEGVLWNAKMPGPSSGTPIIAGDRVFVSSTDANTHDLLALCLSAKDGKELWRRRVGTDREAANGNHMASPSPITDGRSVFFYYGTGDLIAMDLEGKELWRRSLEKDIGNFAVKFGYSSSPLLAQGRLYIPVLRRPTQYATSPRTAKGTDLDSLVLAIDAATGKDIWKQIRPTDVANESCETYITPLPFEAAGRSEILIAGGDSVTGHDPATGKELWRWPYNPSRSDMLRLVPSPVTDGKLIFFVYPRGGTLYAFKPGATGAVKDEIVAWKFNGPTSDSATPLVYDGMLFLLEGDSKKCLTALDPKTGEQKWQAKLGGSTWRASPTGADGRIYCMSEAGEVAVVAAADGKILSRIPMGGDGVCATIAVAGGRLYIRTSTNLYCIGK